MNDWNAIAGRISIFPAPSSVALPSALELYKKVWKEDPVTFQGSKNPLSPSLAQGRRRDLGIGCSVHPSRVDFNLAPGGPETIEDRNFYVIEDSKELYEELVRIARIIGDGLLNSPVIRIATFLQFVSVQAGATEANRKLMTVVPEHYRIKLGDEEEFIMQVNRPRMSKRIEQVKMNLITKWSVERIQIISLLVPAGAPFPIVAPQSGAAPRVNEFIVASVGFDNNNVPVSADKPLSSDQQSSLLLEGLSCTSTSIQEVGLSIKGFENGKSVH